MQRQLRTILSWLLALLLSAPAFGLQAPDGPFTASANPTLAVHGRLDGSHLDVDWSSARPDGHAPIGVAGDHVHEAGEWMISLRAMQMHMGGMRDGTDSLSSADVLGAGYMVTPTEMDTQMLMLGGMYAPTDDLTLMLMLPYLKKEMDHVTGMGTEFTTESEGLGDVRMAGLLNVYRGAGRRVHLNLGLSLPTGDIDERDDTPAAADAKLPYPMQLGSGTIDLLPGVTYLQQSGDWSFGAQGELRVHLGENDEDYTLGDRIDATAWAARRLGSASISLRLRGAHWKEIDGADPDLNPAMVPTADPDNFGGDRVDLLAGANWYGQNGFLRGHRLALELGIPVYQDLNGPQMELDWVATVGWQLAH